MTSLLLTSASYSVRESYEALCNLSDPPGDVQNLTLISPEEGTLFEFSFIDYRNCF